MEQIIISLIKEETIINGYKNTLIYTKDQDGKRYYTLVDGLGLVDEINVFGEVKNIYHSTIKEIENDRHTNTD